jgi:uncharacterized RDD family membrane protein YckC
MTNPPAGWYPDPAPQSAPGRLRYWDGAQWTEHLHDPAPTPAPAPAPTPEPNPAAPAYPGPDPQVPAGASPSYPTSPQPFPQAYGQPYPASGQGDGQPAGTVRTTTPDGVPLSGWWWRVLARILDGFILIPVYALALVPVVASQWHELTQWVDDLSYAADHHLADAPMPALFDFTSGPGIALLLSLVVTNIVWEALFLSWKQATPGKLICGLRVRRRGTPGLTGSAILRRIGFVGAISLASEIPVLGIVFGLVGLVDYLWPLWDSKKQALHDKVAGTNVVRPGPQPVSLTTPGAVSPVEAAVPPRW